MHLIFWIFIFLVVYGSFYPFEFQNFTFTPEIWREFLTPDLYIGKGSIIQNIILFIPSGFIGPYLFEFRKPNSGSFWLYSISYILILFFFAEAIQIGQFYFPARTPDIDAGLCNLLGLFVGYIVAVYFIAARHSFSEFLKAVSQRELMILSICFFYFVYKTFPCIPSLDIRVIKDNLRPLLISPEFYLVTFLDNFLGFMLLCYMLFQVKFLESLLTRLPLFIQRFYSSRFFVVVGFFLCAQPIFLEATLTLSEFLGALCALLIWSLYHKILPEKSYFMVLIYFGLFAYVSLDTFDLLQPPTSFSWTPFSGMITGSTLSNMVSLLYKIYFYSALYFLLSEHFRNLSPVLVAGSLYLFLIELLQIFTPNHNPEMTDPILFILLCIFYERFFVLKDGALKNPR